MRKQIKCARCGLALEYLDEKDLYQQGWDILGWNMNTNTSIATCGKCPSAPIIMALTTHHPLPSTSRKVWERLAAIAYRIT